MAAVNSFDIVSEIDMQEVKNAVDQAMKEIHQRFDFKGSKSDITVDEKENQIVLVSDDQYKLKSVTDILQTRMVKRGVSLKALSFGKVEEALGGTIRQKIQLQQGIAAEQAKEIGKAIRDAKFKVQTQVQGNQIRVMGKSRDELQAVITLLKEKDFGIAMQFTNYR